LKDLDQQANTADNVAETAEDAGAQAGAVAGALNAAASLPTPAKPALTAMAAFFLSISKALGGVAALERQQAAYLKLQVAKAEGKDTADAEKQVMQAGVGVGVYILTFASGMQYVGKGPRERSEASGKRISKDKGDAHTATEFHEIGNDRDAFKQESRTMDKKGGPGGKLYNERKSPGEKYRDEDGTP
jgi:hypothetical protein